MKGKLNAYLDSDRSIFEEMRLFRFVLVSFSTFAVTIYFDFRSCIVDLS